MAEFALKRIMIRFLFGLLVMIFLGRTLVSVLNEYADSTAPSTEALVVTGIGKYYQPFRVDYVSGRSSVLGRTIRVPVLPEVAANTTIGSNANIILGEGLFRKAWFQPADKYRENSEKNFRTGYIAIFVFLFVGWSLVFLKFARPFGLARTLQAYAAAVALGTLSFYVF